MPAEMISRTRRPPTHNSMGATLHYPGRRCRRFSRFVGAEDRIHQAAEAPAQLVEPRHVLQLDAMALAADEACLAQHLEMQRERRFRHGSIADYAEDRADPRAVGRRDVGEDPRPD